MLQNVNESNITTPAKQVTVTDGQTAVAYNDDRILSVIQDSGTITAPVSVLVVVGTLDEILADPDLGPRVQEYLDANQEPPPEPDPVAFPPIKRGLP
jgi:hypothetical protein